MLKRGVVAVLLLGLPGAETDAVQAFFDVIGPGAR